MNDGNRTSNSLRFLALSLTAIDTATPAFISLEPRSELCSLRSAAGGPSASQVRRIWWTTKSIGSRQVVLGQDTSCSPNSGDLHFDSPYVVCPFAPHRS